VAVVVSSSGSFLLLFAVAMAFFVGEIFVSVISSLYLLAMVWLVVALSVADSCCFVAVA